MPKVLSGSGAAAPGAPSAAQPAAAVPAPSILSTRRTTHAGAVPVDPREAPPYILIWTGGYVATDEGSAPDLRQQSLINGVAGVIHKRDGRFETDGLEYNLQRAEHTPLLEIHGEYCAPLAGHPGCYGGPWTRAERGHVVHDEAGYSAWRAALVDRGVIRAPTVVELRHLIDQLDRQLGPAPSNPTDQIKAQRDQLQRRRDALTREIAALEES